MNRNYYRQHLEASKVSDAEKYDMLSVLLDQTHPADVCKALLEACTANGPLRGWVRSFVINFDKRWPAA